jgi:hypothetical protein
MNKKNQLFIIAMLQIGSIASFGQGYNHQWLLGYDTWPNKGRAYIDAGFNFQLEARKMGFTGTEATICDANGNFLISSNGVWVANANNDTMMNGTGLNPGSNVNSWPDGLLNTYANIILPYPGDSTKYVLFHHTDTVFGSNYIVPELFYTTIDMKLDSGRGGVTLKNQIAFYDTLSSGIAACRHANGRDWWIVIMKDSSDIIYKVLFTPNGIESISTQHLNFSPFPWGNLLQLSFSQDGTKLISSTYDNIFQKNSSMVFCDFDRCTGIFSNTHAIPLTVGAYLWGLAFSPSGQYAYACSSNYIFQVNTTTLQVDTVATYDGFCYPFNPYCTTFFNMYLGANGKIYITSGSGVQHIHEMNFPDSVGLASDVQQHSIFLNMWNFRAVPNHPNYYLGRLIGSPCDTVWQGIQEQTNDFNFRIYPNPISNNNLSIGYLLPQNKSGLFSIYDITGKLLFKYSLPQWSNEQSFS